MGTTRKPCSPGRPGSISTSPHVVNGVFCPGVHGAKALIPKGRLYAMLGQMLDQATVLLAEDDPDDVLLTHIAFEKARLANPLQIVRDGEEAIAYLRGDGKFADRTKYPLPILLLLDLKMPKVHGFQVLEWLRRQPLLGRLPVAVMTSSDHDPHVARAYELGADSYLIKPPDAEALLALVQRLHAYWLIVNKRPDLEMANS